MVWNWAEIIEELSESEREYYERIHLQAELLEPIPKTFKNAEIVSKSVLDSIFLKVYEPQFNTLWTKYFQRRLNELKEKIDFRNNDVTQLSIYYPGAKLYVKPIYFDNRASDYVKFRMNTEGGNVYYAEPGYTGGD